MHWYTFLFHYVLHKHVHGWSRCRQKWFPGFFPKSLQDWGSSLTKIIRLVAQPSPTRGDFSKSIPFGLALFFLTCCNVLLKTLYKNSHLSIILKTFMITVFIIQGCIFSGTVIKYLQKPR